MDAVGRLLARRDLADPIEGLERGQFGDPRFDRLYAELLAAGATLEGALRVGLRIEEMDIDDLREALAVPEDVAQVETRRLSGLVPMDPALRRCPSGNLCHSVRERRLSDRDSL